jgi:hypothetical protein
VRVIRSTVQLSIVLLLVLLALIGFRKSRNKPVGASPYLPMATKGPEIWKIGNKTYQISYTYYIKMPKGLQYTIECPWPAGIKPDEQTQENASDLAFPLMQYACEEELYKRATIRQHGKGKITATLVGVVFFEKKGIVFSGIRANLTIDEIKKKIEAAESGKSIEDVAK